MNFKKDSTLRCLMSLVWVSLLAFSLSSSVLAADKASSPSGTLTSILKTKKLRVGVSLFTPWTMKNGKGELRGFEIDVAKQLAKDLGVKPTFQVLDWKDIVPALLNRKIDIIVAGMVITPQRALKVNFSQPYSSSGIGLVTNITLTKKFTGPKGSE